MEEQLHELYKQYTEKATSEEKDILLTILKGLNKRKSKKQGSYIGGLLNMEKTLNKHICELTIPITPLLNNSLDIVHGGITATLIDSAMGTLANHVLPEEYGAVTTQLNIHYLSIGKGEYLTCKARIDHKGTKTMVMSADVYRCDGKKIAQASGSFFIIGKKL